jgi:hypothetical protein
MIFCQNSFCCLGAQVCYRDVVNCRRIVTGPRARASLVALLALAVLASGFGCESRRYDPSKATRSYPFPLHTTNVVDMQLFRDSTDIEIYNSTATSYQDFDLWINQRYTKRVASLPAGGYVRLSLYDFWDMWGENISAGGPFRTLPPMPVRLAQIQTGEAAPLIGLISIPAPEDRPD